jgi:uncharacterized protein YkwD
MLTGRGTEARAERLTHSMQSSHQRAGSNLRNRALTSLCCLLWVTLSLTSRAYSQQAFDAAGEQRLFSLINQERVKQGLAPLELDERLMRSARKHTQLMVQNDSLSHEFDGEEALQLRVSDENLRCDRDGENIALDGDIERAHLMLMQSPPHRANILNPQFNAVGIGILKTDELYYITEDFTHVLPDYSELEADAAVQQAVSNYAKSLGVPPPARKPRAQLEHLACDMAREDTLHSKEIGEIPGATSAVAWTATDLGKLPPNLKRLLAQPLSSGYSLGVCFAPSVSHPGGVYWLVMVIY